MFFSLHAKSKTPHKLDSGLFNCSVPHYGSFKQHLHCESNYCLPVYVRCNGVYDCVGHEDEADCESYTCPGFYRCRASSVCVHVDHLYRSGWRTAFA
nr:hypothetical protein BaRGS_013432 [Batillaria attramentaria]